MVVEREGLKLPTDTILRQFHPHNPSPSDLCYVIPRSPLFSSWLLSRKFVGCVMLVRLSDLRRDVFLFRYP